MSCTAARIGFNSENLESAGGSPVRSTISTIFAGSLLAGLVSPGVQAMPIAPSQSGLHAPGVTLIRDDCGRGKHRDRLGVCVLDRERVIVEPRPGVIVLEPRACPIGLHWSQFRRECVIN
jgi:hypothetical protein